MPRFAFDLSSPLTLPITLPLALVGLAPHLAHVTVEHDVLDVRFGCVRLRTPVSNVADVDVTGPSNPLRTLGVHVSLSDLGLTFGSNYRRGVCIRFERPVSGVLPIPFLAHPGLTVTVADPEGLRDTLLSRREAALAEAERLVAGNPPIAHPPAQRARATRTAQRAGTALEVVRPVETAVEPVVTDDDPDVITGTAEPSSRRATRPASTPRKAATGRTTVRRVDEPAPIEREVTKRELAGNRPDPEQLTAAEEPPVPSGGGDVGGDDGGDGGQPSGATG